MKQPIEPGMPITARAINAGIEARNILEVSGVSPPLEIIKTKHGRFLRLAMQFLNVQLGVTGSGGISAGSGTTPGSGSVTFYKFSPPTPTLTTTPISETVWNIFSSSVAASKNVIVIKIGGVWWVVSADC